MNENNEEIVFEGTVDDQIAAVLKSMSDFDPTSKEFKELSDILFKLLDSKNETTKIENEADRKRKELKLEKKKLKDEKKQKKLEREAKEKELKSQRRVALITGGASVLVAAIAGFASGYSTKMNRRNLEDTLNFEKTGIVRSAGHKHVSKKG